LQASRVSCWGYGDAAVPCAGAMMVGNHQTVQYTGGFEGTKMNIMWGFNAAETNPFNIMRPAIDQQEKGVKLVVVEALFTPTAAKADQYIEIRPSTDVAMILAMMNEIIKQGWVDEEFTRKYTVGAFLVRGDNGMFLREKDVVSGDSEAYLVWDTGQGKAKPVDPEDVNTALTGSYTVNGIECNPAFQLLKELAEQYPAEVAEEITSVPAEVILKLTHEYIANKPTSIYYSNGLGRSFHGEIIYRALITMAAITGTSKPPQDPHYRSWTLNWGAFTHPNKEAPSYRRLPVMNLYDAITKDEPYPVRMAWFAFVNFVNQCADSNRIYKELLPKLDLIVDTELFMTPTAEISDYVLPVCTFLEHTDLVDGHPYLWPYMQLQDAVVDPIGEAKSDMQIVCELGKRLGLETWFDKTDEEFVDVLLDSGHPTVEGINVKSLRENGAMPVDFSKNKPRSHFNTPSGRIEFYIEKLLPFGEALPVYKEPLESQRSPLAEKYPLVLMSTHSRYSTHSMFRNVPNIREIEPEPFLMIHPEDAQARGIKDGDMALVINDRGRATMKAKVNPGIRKGVVANQEGWWFKDYAEGGLNCLTHNEINPAQQVAYEPNMAMNDVLVEVKKA
ncbi:molybdopterin-dependent oxidoreductase, partial [Chloroflexota bacterium]